MTAYDALRVFACPNGYVSPTAYDLASGWGFRVGIFHTPRATLRPFQAATDSGDAAVAELRGIIRPSDPTIMVVTVGRFVLIRDGAVAMLPPPYEAPH